MEQNLHRGVCQAFPELKERDPAMLSPLVLAYVGDTVYDLFVRTMLIHTTDLTAHGLHLNAAKHVSAGAQSKAFHRIKAMLTQEEEYFFKRGRNAHMGTIPKHATISDYRAATGLETLIGYLYLTGQDGRLRELMGHILFNNDDRRNQDA